MVEKAYKLRENPRRACHPLDGINKRKSNILPKLTALPVWGPGNSILFFNRTDDSQLEQLYYVDTVTGNVRQYLDPTAINGAVQIIDAAF